MRSIHFGRAYPALPRFAHRSPKRSPPIRVTVRAARTTGRRALLRTRPPAIRERWPRNPRPSGAIGLRADRRGRVANRALRPVHRALSGTLLHAWTGFRARRGGGHSRLQGSRLERGRRCRSMKSCPRDITRFASAPKGRGYPSTSGLRTASAIPKHGSFCPTSAGGPNGRRAPTRRSFSRSTRFSSSIAHSAFQRTNING